MSAVVDASLLVAATTDAGVEGVWAEDVLREGRLIAPDLALVEATTEGYRERGRFTPPNKPEHPRGPREAAWAHPVVANGRLYIRDLGTLWCYDVRASAASR